MLLFNSKNRDEGKGKSHSGTSLFELDSFILRTR